MLALILTAALCQHPRPLPPKLAVHHSCISRVGHGLKIAGKYAAGGALRLVLNDRGEPNW